MTALHELQRRFRDAVLFAAPAPDEILGGRVPAAARIDIYRNNVVGNLTRALRLTYPAIERLVGEAFFATAAAGFINASLPTSADLYQYGCGFADFLAQFEPAIPLAYLPDVARLEWAVVGALHAPPAAPLDLAALATIPSECQPDLVFTPHPTLSLLALATPARAIWEAVLIADEDARAAALGAIAPSGLRETLAVLRPGETLAVAPLAPAAFTLARSLAGGRRLVDALEDLAPEEAPSALTELLNYGLFVGVDDDSNQ